jgi:hypothetical protein
MASSTMNATSAARKIVSKRRSPGGNRKAWS